MTNQTKIEWTDFTVNFWEGCQKVGPGCDHCYAEARDIRFTGGSHWGPHAPRRKVKSGVQKLLTIQRKAHEFRAEHGHWPRVFCSSLSDVFDNAVDRGWRHEAFATIDLCTNTRVQLLTKRVGNVFDMIPPGWASRELGGWPSHVGLMITVVNQEEADRDIPKLLDLKARLGIPWIGLSMEPLLGPVDLTAIERTGGELGFMRPLDGRFTTLDWIIVGGESGHQARPMHPDWPRSLRDQCVAAGVPFLFKQWGEWLPYSQCRTGDQREAVRVTTIRSNKTGDGSQTYFGKALTRHPDGQMVTTTTPGIRPEQINRVGKVRAGRHLDRRTWDQFPEALG